jgi:hypothetical protein
MNLSATHERGIQNWRSGCALCDSARYFVALRLRFELSGDREDLDNGISASREAVAFLPRGHPYRAGMASNLGIALQARFNLSGGMEDLDEAIEAGREALSSTPNGYL